MAASRSFDISSSQPSASAVRRIVYQAVIPPGGGESKRGKAGSNLPTSPPLAALPSQRAGRSGSITSARASPTTSMVATRQSSRRLDLVLEAAAHHQRDGGSSPRPMRERDEVRTAPAAVGRRARTREIRAAADVDQIDRCRVQTLHHGERVVLAQSALETVGGIQLDTDREAWPDTVAHRIDHLDDEAGTGENVAAVGIGAAVEQRREKLAQQEAVRRMDFDRRRSRAPAGSTRSPRNVREARRCLPPTSASQWKSPMSSAEGPRPVRELRVGRARRHGRAVPTARIPPASLPWPAYRARSCWRKRRRSGCRASRDTVRPPAPRRRSTARPRPRAQRA